MNSPVVSIIEELAEKYSAPPVRKSPAALELEAAGWRVWYATMFGQSFVDALAPHHVQALAWHWAARTNLILGVVVQYLAYFSIWSRGHMKTTLARYMVVADACLSIGNGGSYALIVGGTVKKVRGTAATMQTLLESDRVKQYYPELAEVKKNERGGSKGWTADFINTKAGAVFHFIGLDQGVAGANVDNLRPTFIVPDDIDDREDSPVISDARFKTFTTSVLPTRQGNTLVFFAQNLISRFSIMYRIFKQHARVLTYRLKTEPIPAVIDLITERRTVDTIVKDVYVSGTPTWKVWDAKRIQEEIESYGLPAFLRECQHEVDQSKEGVMLQNYNDDVHVISESEFASVYGSLSAWQLWAKWTYNDWSRTKTAKHANVAGYITVSSQNTIFPGATFMFYPMSFVANTEAEDVAERLLSALSPIAYNATTWAQLRKDELLRANAARHTKTYEEETRFKRAALARIIPQYSRPLLERWNVKRGVMSHSEDTVRDVFNRVFGFNFHPSNPKKFDAIEAINIALQIDFSERHPFRPEQMGYTRFFIVAPDDKNDLNPRIVNGKYVYRPIPYNDALSPDELFDWDLLRYQLKSWRIRDTVQTVRGESDDTPLKLNDDFGQSLQMIYHKRLIQNVELTKEEEFAARIARDKPHLTQSAIESDPDPGQRSQKYASLIEEQKKFQRDAGRNYERDNAFAELHRAQNLDDDLSWLENL